MTPPDLPERPMYNAPLKRRFVASSNYKYSTQQQLLKLFRATASYEEKWSADFSRLDFSQTSEVVNAICGFRSDGANVIFLLLKEYVKWCRAQGMETSDAMWKVKVDVVEKMRGAFVGSPQHLKMSLDEAFPNAADNEIQYVYRSFLWFAFMGLFDSEAIQITANDIDFEEMQVNFDGRAFKIYVESLRDFRKICELTSFKEPRGKFGVDKERDVGDSVLRGKKSKKEKSMQDFLVTTLRPMVSRAFSNAVAAYESKGIPVPPNISLELTYKHIYMSGIFYRIYEGERIGIPPRFNEVVIREYVLSKQTKFNKNYTYNKLINHYIRGYEVDYMNWKSLFG